MQYRKKFFHLCVALFLVFACGKDNLNQPVIGYVDETKLANKAGVEGLLIGAYSLLDGFSLDDEALLGGVGTSASNWIYGSVAGTEAYTGAGENEHTDIRTIEQFSVSVTNALVHDKWRVSYAGVQRANDVLRILPKAKNVSQADSLRIAAEARFLRAHYHFEAIKMWNKVPFVHESITYDAGNYQLANDTLIWPAIERDFSYAMEHLPIQASAIGRANRYAAEAFLAKAYVFQKKWALARQLLQHLINNGVTAAGKKYELVNYADNFNPDASTKNSAESVFAVQMSVNDGGGGANGNWGGALNFPVFTNPDIPAPGGCCGLFQPSQYLVNHFKTDAVSGLPYFDNFNASDVKNDEGLAASDPFTPETRTLDPRLDWTVGRRGIPYLDWGNHPGKAWIPQQGVSGPYSPKKNAYYKWQQAAVTDGWTSLTANNVNLIRFADVLLWAAEVEAELGDLVKAREYVNQVRRRAANPAGWVKKPDGTLAANYKIGEYTTPWTDVEFARKAVRYERALELALEGHRFFDLVRWGIADMEINTYLKKEKTKRLYLNTAEFRKNTNEYFPIPQPEIDLSTGADGVPRLKQNPGY